VGGSKTDPLQPFDGVYSAQQLGEGYFSGKRLSIGVYVLPEEHDLFNATAYEILNLPQDSFTWAAGLAAAHVRNNAEAADLVATLHDGDKGLGPLNLASPCGVFHVKRIAVKSSLYGTVAGQLDLLHHLGEFVDVVGSEDKVQMRDTAQESFAFLLRNASANADDQPVPFFLQLAPAAEGTVDFLFRFITDTTGI
jgi:hypothetical protein